MKVETKITSQVISPPSPPSLPPILAAQVVKLFELAGLGQYTDVVVDEGITGDILIECDEPMLENEMAIKSNRDRLNLLLIIEGKADTHLYTLQD